MSRKSSFLWLLVLLAFKVLLFLWYAKDEGYTEAAKFFGFLYGGLIGFWVLCHIFGLHEGKTIIAVYLLLAVGYGLYWELEIHEKGTDPNTTTAMVVLTVVSGFVLSQLTLKK